MPWQKLFTAKWRVRNLSLLSLLIVAVMLLASCATPKKSAVEVGVPSGPSEATSAESLIQGLQYIRENPTEREDERVQRFLWLDQWMVILASKNRLSQEMSFEFWNDLTSFVNSPPMSSFGLQKILERAGNPLAQNVAHYQLYINALREASFEGALEFLTFIKEDGVTDLYARAQQLLQLRNIQEVSESRKIGVLLPLSGDLKSFGEEALLAIQLVAELSFSEGIEFLIEDIGTSDDQLLEAFQSLVLDENVTALIGPLTAKKSEFVFERAQILRVPIISLALTEGLEFFGDYNFRSALSLKDQVFAVSDFIRRDLKARNVGMLFPDTSYGWDVAKLAESEFKRNRLDLREVQVYEEGQTDFKAALQKMTRLDFPRLRSDELCQEGEEPAPGACTESLDDLPPILTFEVLFVPETSPDTAGLLLPTLPFLGIHGVQVIGLSGFHSPQLIKRAGESADNTIFTDGFYVDAEDLGTREFVDRYQALAGRKPSNLSAEAFDVALALAQILKTRQSAMTRDQMQQSIRSLRDFSGVTGSLTTDRQEIRKRPRFFVVREGDFHRLR